MEASKLGMLGIPTEKQAVSTRFLYQEEMPHSESSDHFIGKSKIEKEIGEGHTSVIVYGISALDTCGS